MSFSGVSFGLLANFDHLQQEWTSYKSRLQQWYIANDITDESDKLKVKRRAILLSALTGPTYMLARDLALSKKLEETNYEEILLLLDRHFEPTRLGFAEKSIFYAAAQRLEESHAQWAARIRGLAAHCGFKALEEALLDKFIMGMLPGRERDKLFAQDQNVLTLAKAVEIAESVRCARRAALTAPVPSGSSAGAGSGEDGLVCVVKEKCIVCGYNNNKSNQCRFKNYKCKKCNIKGHLRKMCPSSTKVNHVEEGQVDEGDDDPYGNPQYPPPQGQIYPQLYNQVNAPAPAPQQMQPGQPGFPYQGQYQHGPGYPYQQGQQPTAMSYPNVTPMAPSAPPGPGYGYQGYPNITPTHINEPVVEWIPTTPYDAVHFTNRAVVAGYEGHDGSPLWVIRARYEGDLIPGKLAIKHKAAYIPWGGEENVVKNIEVCCARPEKIKWVQSRDGVMPHNAVVSGSTKDGEPLYVGRVQHQGSLTPGKVHPSHKVLYISFAGQEIPNNVYEVMCTV